MNNPLDAVLVHLVTKEGHKITVYASSIRRMTSFVAELSPDGNSVDVTEGSSLFLADSSQIALRGTYEENMAIWKAAIEPVAAMLRPKWFLPYGSGFPIRFSCRHCGDMNAEYPHSCKQSDKFYAAAEAHQKKKDAGTCSCVRPCHSCGHPKRGEYSHSDGCEKCKVMAPKDDGGR